MLTEARARVAGQVHTPFTTRAKELMQLYNGLRLPLLSTDERLDVLLHVKWTVKEFDCNLTRALVELIDREADLLNRGRSPTAMDGLRKCVSGPNTTRPAYRTTAHEQKHTHVMRQHGRHRQCRRNHATELCSC